MAVAVVAGAGVLFAASAYATGPANDNQANATVLTQTGTGTLTQSTVGATKEVGESDHAGDAGGASVWFKWTPSFSGTAYVKTTGSDFDTLLDIAGSGVSSSNDDIQESAGVGEACFDATSGQTVTIAVDGYLAATGNLTLTWGQFDNSISCPKAPPTITGNTAAPVVGDMFTGISGSWVAPSGTDTFQWWRCHEHGCLKISGATGHTYTVQSRDIGEAIMFEETMTLNAPTSTRSASNLTGTVARQNNGLTDGRIFWATNEGHQGNFDLYSMFPDASHLLQVTTDPVHFESQASTTINGTALSYVDEYTGQIIVSDPDGGNAASTGIVGSWPQWSPDLGSRLAYISINNGVYITDGVNNDPVTLLTGANWFGLSWSRDGTKLAFSFKPSGASNYQIAVMNADGRSPMKVITSGAFDNWDPSWSPDGTKIAFLHGQVDLPINERDLYEMSADGTNQTLFVAGSGQWPNDTNATTVNAVSWSPSGNFLLYARATGAASDNLFKIPAGLPGGTPVQLTHSTAYGVTQDNPYWAPQADFPLHVGITGNGTVAGSPTLPCSSATSCDNTYLDGNTVTLTAAPSAGSVFSGWGGACAGTGQCTLPMTGPRNATATFSVPGSSGGGGGGGGGGGSVPDLAVKIAVSKTTAKIDDVIDFTTSITNSGGAGALQSHAYIFVPGGATLLGPPAFESGSGCKPSATVANMEDCNIDYVPNGGTTHLRYEMKLTKAGDPDFSVSVTSDRDSNPNNNADHLSVHVDGLLAGGGGTTTSPAPAPRAPSSPTVGVHKTGNSAANTMNGTAKNDSLNGAGGNDLLKGFAGNDTLLGGLGNDRIVGGAGNDRLVGGPGKDVLHGDAGTDTIDARDSQTDTVDCGAGHDTVNADKHDIVSHNCEVVHRK